MSQRAQLTEFVKPLSRFAHENVIVSSAAPVYTCVADDSQLDVVSGGAQAQAGCVCDARSDGRPVSALWRFGSNRLFDRNVLGIIKKFLGYSML
jgi:hypothetical protein